MKQNSVLQKLLNKLAPVPEATKAEDIVQAATEEASVELSTLKAELEAGKAEIATLASALETALAAVAEADSNVAAMQAKMQEFTAQIEAEKLQAEAKRQEARKAAVEAAVGTAKADGLMAATAALDDAAFQAVVDALSLSVEAEANSAMFNEAGASAEADVDAAGESAEMKIIKDRYKSKGTK